MLSTYRENAKERENQGIPPLPLDAAQTQALTELLQNPPAGEEQTFLWRGRAGARAGKGGTTKGGSTRRWDRTAAKGARTRTE